MQVEKLNLQLLIEGCRSNNRRSQKRLYEHFYGYGMNICLRYAKDRVEAEEMLNDGFLKALLNIDKYDPAFPFRAWLRKILINSAIDYYRKYQKYQLTLSMDQLAEIPDDVPLPAIDEGEDVLPILQELPRAYRMAFNLYVIEGYKHHEIAELLNISVGTSKSNLARAKTKLKALWLNKKGGAAKLNRHG